MNGVYFHQISNNQALATHTIIGVSISEAISLTFINKLLNVGLFYQQKNFILVGFELS